jgi:hypothetical protein
MLYKHVNNKLNNPLHPLTPEEEMVGPTAEESG